MIKAPNLLYIYINIYLVDKDWEAPENAYLSTFFRGLSWSLLIWVLPQLNYVSGIFIYWLTPTKVINFGNNYAYQM